MLSRYVNTHKHMYASAFTKKLKSNERTCRYVRNGVTCEDYVQQEGYSSCAVPGSCSGTQWLFVVCSCLFWWLCSFAYFYGCLYQTWSCMLCMSCIFVLCVSFIFNDWPPHSHNVSGQAKMVRQGDQGVPVKAQHDLHASWRTVGWCLPPSSQSSSFFSHLHPNDLFHSTPSCSQTTVSPRIFPPPSCTGTPILPPGTTAASILPPPPFMSPTFR